MALVDGVLDLGDQQSHAQRRGEGVTIIQHLGKVLSGVDVQDRKRKLLGREGLDGQIQQHRGILATGEEQDRPLALGRHLAQDKDGVGLQ
jgi:hypothetical protein